MQGQERAMYSLHDSQLYVPLLQHPSFTQDQQVLLRLQQTSQTLHASLAQQLPRGQLPVVLRTNNPRNLELLVLWLKKHAVLCQGLELQLLPYSNASNRGGYDCLRVEDVRWPEVLAGLGTALQCAAAAATGTLQLQSFSLQGSPTDVAFLEQLAAHHLTRLRVELDFCSSPSMQAVAAMTGLRSLHLTDPSGRWLTADDALAPLAAGLQQLTQLHVSPVRLEQLQHLPPQLQQLHVALYLQEDVQQLLQLAGWLQQHSGIVSSLELLHGPRRVPDAAWTTAVDTFAAALHAAATQDRSGCRLQSLSLLWYQSGEPARLLQQLPVDSLTQLRCCANMADAADVAALCSLTSLHSLRLFGCSRAQPDDVLLPLSALQQLTQLQLDGARCAQLLHLQLPQLRQLSVDSCSFSEGQRLQLGHLSTLQKLQLKEDEADRAQRGHGHQRGNALAGVAAVDTQLPESLRELHWERAYKAKGCDVQTLLLLSRLEMLELLGGLTTHATQQLPRLSSLDSLQDLRLTCSAAAAAACSAAQLPIKALFVSSDDATPAVLQQLGALRGLTSLQISGKHLAATLGQLAATLAQLSTLQVFVATTFSTTAAERPAHLTRSRAAASSSGCGVAGNGAASGGSDKGAAVGCSAGGARVLHDAEGLGTLLQAVGGMPNLGSVCVDLPVLLRSGEAQQLRQLVQQQLPGYMARCLSASKGGKTFTLKMGCF